MLTSTRSHGFRVFQCMLGLIGVGGCVRASDSDTGVPEEIRANFSDFLADLTREALAAFLL